MMVGDIAGAKDNLEHNLLNPFNVTDVFGCEHRGKHWSSVFQYRTDLHCIEEQDIIITDTSRFQSRDGPESTVSYFQDVRYMSIWFHVSCEVITQEFCFKTPINLLKRARDVKEGLEVIGREVDNHKLGLVRVKDHFPVITYRLHGFNCSLEEGVFVR